MMAAGARTGALVLIVVAALVLCPLAWAFFRLWRREMTREQVP